MSIITPASGSSGKWIWSVHRSLWFMMIIMILGCSIACMSVISFTEQTALASVLCKWEDRCCPRTVPFQWHIHWHARTHADLYVACLRAQAELQDQWCRCRWIYNLAMCPFCKVANHDRLQKKDSSRCKNSASPVKCLALQTAFKWNHNNVKVIRHAAEGCYMNIFYNVYY